MRIDENEEEIISIELWKATMNVEIMVRTEHKYSSDEYALKKLP